MLTQEKRLKIYMLIRLILHNSNLRDNNEIKNDVSGKKLKNKLRNYNKVYKKKKKNNNQYKIKYLF